MKIRKKMRTASNLIKQYGIQGLIKGSYNKLQGKNLLEGLYVQAGSPILESCRYEAFKTTLFNAMSYIDCEPRQYRQEDMYSCTVVIPVYNGLEHLKRLLPSLVKNTPIDVPVVLINDCSTDSEVIQYINKFLVERENWMLIENEKNYGFVKTVNRGMKEVHTDYALLLNTDTLVPSNWIPKMITPFIENKKIATTTPFTNAGVYFSYPHFCEDNSINEDIETINQAFDRVVSNEYALNEIHSGTGFCMGINMTCWHEIGELDYKNFGKGYGEENDWCFRALEKGWKHLIVPNLFVFHLHGGSFLTEEKKKLMEEHQVILKKKYTSILNEMVPRFYRDDPWKVYRYAAALLMCAENLTLYIDIRFAENQISGAVDYSKKEIQKRIEEGERIIIAHYNSQSTQWYICPYSVDSRMEIPLEDIADIEFLFEKLNVKRVIVNNLAYCENAEKAATIFVRLRKEYSFELDYKFHDYLSVCPSFFLINKDKVPCNPLDYEYCKTCIQESKTKAVQRNYLVQWRFVFNQFFHQVDHCYFFSNYTKEIVSKVYPQIESKAIVKYHDALMTGEESRYIRPSYSGTWNIGFVGNFCMEKGSEYFVSLAKLLKRKGVRAQFTIIGSDNSGQSLSGIRVLGAYTRNNLGQLLTDYKIHMVIYPSIANETFSYVAQELMLLNVPLVVFPCGAPQERIKASQYKMAEVTDAVSVNSLYKATDKLAEKVYHRSLLQ